MSQPPIIIKRIKKIEAGHHGGSWKIAYADFLAGMMTFFLLMWLISLMSPKKKAAIAGYFRHFNIFKKAGISMLMEYYRTGTIRLNRMPQAIIPETIEQMPQIKGTGKRLKQLVKTRLASLKQHILIRTVRLPSEKKVVKIEIVDLVGKPLFRPGSAIPSPELQKILKVFAKELKDMPVKIDVEGHTDATTGRGGQMVNWQLSAARALTSMLLLEKYGVPDSQILKVVGCGDKFPLFKNNPYDPRNRRITLTLHFNRTAL